MFKLDLEKAEGSEVKLSTCIGSSKKQESSRKKHVLLLYWLCQSFWPCGSQQTGKFLKRWAYQTTWPASWVGFTTVERGECNFIWRLRIGVTEKIASEQSFEEGGKCISHINIRRHSLYGDPEGLDIVRCLIFYTILKIKFHLQLLQNTGYIPHVVWYILESILYPTICTSHSHAPMWPLSLLSTSKVKWSEVRVTQSCLTLCDLGILQARRLEWVAYPFSSRFPDPGIDWGLLHCRWILYQLSYQRSPHW